jgi:hypothetical protein
MTENVQFWLAGLCLGVLILTALLEHEKRFDYSVSALPERPAENMATVATTN